MLQRIKTEAYISSFKKGITKKPFSEKKDTELDADSKELFSAAVRQGYLDASRTFHGIKEHPKELESGLDSLAVKIKEYFKNNNAQDFDHAGFCDCLNGIPDIAFGQKQKIVNMAFKYLFCCSRASTDYRDLFKPCHMALDSYTLRWYKRETETKQNFEWSKLTEKQYNDIHNKIFSIVQKKNTTEIELEFQIWQDEILLESLKNINSVLAKTIRNTSNQEIKLQLDQLKETLLK